MIRLMFMTRHDIEKLLPASAHTVAAICCKYENPARAIGCSPGRKADR